MRHDRADPDDTDLLTATIRSPLTMLGSPLFTDATDFVGNRYWAVSRSHRRASSIADRSAGARRQTNRQARCGGGRASCRVVAQGAADVARHVAPGVPDLDSNQLRSIR